MVDTGNLTKIKAQYTFSCFQTEMTTAERELDQNTNFDWNRIQESGQEVEPLFGPGYTGLVNLGNSCYLASTMQVVFSTQSFHSRYYLSQSLKAAFETAPADPTVDLNMQFEMEILTGSSGPDRSLLCFDGWVTFNQLDCQIAGLLLSLVYSSGFDNNPFNTFKLYGRTKLAHGMLSGKYSFPASEKIDIANAAAPMSSSVSFLATFAYFMKTRRHTPRMFKAVIAASHPEFSSMRQQDVWVSLAPCRVNFYAWEVSQMLMLVPFLTSLIVLVAPKIWLVAWVVPHFLSILVYTSRRVIKNAILCNVACIHVLVT
ncbi:Ubiquitin carboxyl-terminal hydrolase 14 [Vitis vinifera]|uniref:Ubiquitin carboxyl-terminal hydrolase 14 n=1 Tax=Vitis vinifera TaxID=29760 RepID=A0A438CS80_VITVI|nr:Ubiquitin carboxyl-terminal hydrolase 14 [Vitis vinifera]